MLEKIFIYQIIFYIWIIRENALSTNINQGCRLNLRIIIKFILIIILTTASIQAEESPYNYSPKELSRSLEVTNPTVENRVHRRSNMWMNITNWGFFGNRKIGTSEAMEDPEYPGTWAPQCEYPGGSDVQYLFMGTLWVGALVQEEGYEFPRVSTGSEGWFQPRIYEFFPGSGPDDGIEERTTRANQWNRLGDYISHPLAVSEQDFIAVFSDTLTDPYWLNSDPIDGPHYPLGIKIIQKSYSWTYNYAQDFIIIDYEIENIASNYLKNVYVGLYVDADVGRIDEFPDWHQDDICGFQRYYYYERPDGIQDSLFIDIAFIADNDGRPSSAASGTDFMSPDVTGTRVVRAPNPRLQTAFNWWISNGNPDLDFGPSWIDDLSGGWTNTFGTPVGDARKYFVMSNREFDYDQVYVNNEEYLIDLSQELHYRNPASGEWVDEEHNWKIEILDVAADLANGYDTRYLLSWGPLGVFDHTDEAGNDIFRLNPGEKFNMTIGYVAGDNFHDTANPQISANEIDPAKFNFTDLRYNAAWAAWVYDNPMVDTPIYNYGYDGNPDIHDADGSQGDGVMDTGDGWFGEDTGSDGLYAILEPGEDSTAVYYFGVFKGHYSGPDADGSEMNGKLDPGEDDWSGPEYFFSEKYGELDFGYMRNNYILNAGDGIPDFQGPPPPPIPELKYEITENEVILKWSKIPSEDPFYQDPFSRMQDFEGYKIYISTSGLENDFSLIADLDRVDFSYFSETDSMATYPDTRTNAPADTVIDFKTLYRRAVGLNTGLESLMDSDSTYTFVFQNIHSLYPKWYSITAYDYGDPRTGTGPLETARTANAIYIAPSGLPQNPVMVVPNPYRAYLDYTIQHIDGSSWENQDDGSIEFYPESDRRLEFINLPEKALIRVFTIAGDLVAVIPHNIEGDSNTGWVSDYSEAWDLNSRNLQQVCSGLYLFSVEDYTTENKGKISAGKFVIIR